MAEGKKGFVLYCDLLAMVSKLPDDKAGILFKTILGYVNDLNPEPDDILIQVAFEPIKQQLKRDLKDWESERCKRSEAGKKGMKSRWENITKHNSVINPITNITDTVKVTVTDTVKVKRVNRAFSPPTQDEVVNELNKNLDDFTAMAEAAKFVDFYSSNGWKVGKNPMKDWKSAVRNWVRNIGKFSIKKIADGKLGTSEARINRAANW